MLGPHGQTLLVHDLPEVPGVCLFVCFGFLRQGLSVLALAILGLLYRPGRPVIHLPLIRLPLSPQFWD